MLASMRTPYDDYRALLEGSATLDLASWCVLRLTGSEAIPFLQGMATQDLTALEPGRALRTLFLTEKGRPVTHAWVALDPSEGPESGGPAALLLADEGARMSLRPHFERFRIMEDVEFEGPDGTPRLVGVAGSNRARRLTLAKNVPGALAIDAEPLCFLIISGDNYLKELPEFAGSEAAEAWRLHVGLPRTGIDFDTDRIATELELPDAVSFTKGCYVGQEVVARTSNRGQVRRRRVGFRFEWPGAPLPHRAEIRADGVPVGFVTSSARVPESTHGFGMGYLATEALQNPGELVAVHDHQTSSLLVANWPL